MELIREVFMEFRQFSVAVALICGSTSHPIWAEDISSGDPAKGEKSFKQCQSCHVVKNDAGEVLAGRNATVGPNLYKVAGRTAGTVDGFRYSKSLSQAGEVGLKWDEAAFVAYVADPSGFLKEYLGEQTARGKMSFKVRKEADAVNLYAFLATLR